jgi:hypothetical protein
MGGSVSSSSDVLHTLDPVNRIALGNRFEIGQWRVNGQREMPPPACGDAHVFAEDGGPLPGRYLKKMNLAPASLPDDGVAMGGFDVFHPVGVRSQHRDEVMFALHRCDHDGIRTHAAGYTTADFKRGLETRREAEA